MPAAAPQTSNQKEKEYVRVAPCLYRHAKSGRYYGSKKVHGKCHERSLRTTDRQIADNRLREWEASLGKVNSEVEKMKLHELVQKFVTTGQGLAKNTQVTNNAIIKSFKKWMGKAYYEEVRRVRPTQLDEWLASEEPRLRNTTYNRYAGFLKQLFKLAEKDRIISDSPANSLRTPWKKPQEVKRICPTFTDQFPKIVESIRSQPFSDHAKDTADFVEFMGLAGLGQAEASSLTWGDIEWKENRLRIRRHKTNKIFHVPIYDHLRPLLERLKKERGAMFPSARVFKIKDAKKALTSACKRLGYPHFSQRSLRQSLIRHMLRQGVDYKLVARFQGHTDGGELVLSVYSEARAEDDNAWTKTQLAKLGTASKLKCA